MLKIKHLSYFFVWSLTLQSFGLFMCNAQKIIQETEMSTDKQCSYFINVEYLDGMRNNPFGLYEGFSSVFLAKHDSTDNTITLCDRNSEYFNFTSDKKTTFDKNGQTPYQVNISKDSLILFEQSEDGNTTKHEFVSTTRVTDQLWDKQDIVPTVNFLLLNDYFKEHYNVDLTDKLRIEGNITYDLYTIWGDILLIRSNQWENIYYVKKTSQRVEFYKYTNLCDLMFSGLDFFTAANGRLRLKYHIKLKDYQHNKSNITIEKNKRQVVEDSCSPVYYINLRHLADIKENPLKTKYEMDLFEFSFLQFDFSDSLISGVTYDSYCEGVVSKTDSLLYVVSDGNYPTYTLGFEGDTIFLSPVEIPVGINKNNRIVYKYILTNLMNSSIWRCGDPIGVVNAIILNYYLSEKYHFKLIRKLHLKFPYTYHKYSSFEDSMLISSNNWDCRHVWMIDTISDNVRIYKYLNFKDIIYAKDGIPQLKLKYELREMEY